MRHLLCGAAFCLAAVIPGSRAAAQPPPEPAIQPFQAPTGFALMSSTRKDARGYHLLYGATSPDANWSIAQWSNPSADLSPFKSVPVGSGPGRARWASATDSASVAIERNLDGSFIETLAESGSPLPCAKPNEFDLYVATNSKGVQPAFPSSYLGDLYGWVPNLGQLRSLRVTGTLQILAIGERPRQPPCRINQVGGGFTFVLGNKVAQPRQVLFYSVSTFGYCLPDGPQWCSSALPQYYNPGRPGLGPHGEVTGVGFGFGDPLASYGQHKFSDTQPHALDLDVLPVLRRWIQTGTTGLVHGSSAGQPYKLDTDISHWTVGGFYYGQAIWGGAYMSTRWTGFVPIMTTGVPEPAVAHAKPPSTP